MIRRLAAAALVILGYAAGTTGAADAKATINLSARDVAFYAGPLAIIAHGNVTIAASGFGRGGADAAYVDMRKNRIVLAGHAHLGTHSGDALEVDAETGTVDVLSVEDGATDGDFTFPDLNPRDVFIRSRHVAIVAHANARFTPASFPSSAGAVPVPSYLYTYSEGAGFAAQSLPGAAFDQPYGLLGSPSSLLAAHVRYVTGTGPDLAIDQHLVDGNRSYLVSSLDSPTSATRSLGINGYRQLGRRYTTEIDGTGNAYAYDLHTSQTAAFGRAGARIDTTLFSGGGATSDLTVRSPDRPLPLGLTYRLQGDLGVQYQRGGVLAQLPDATQYTTLWHKGLDLFIATPQFRMPLRTSLGMTFDSGETSYAYPHSHGTFSGTGTLTRRLGTTVTLTGIYAQSEDLESFGPVQGLFYPPLLPTLIAPDGTPWPGYAAFTGATTQRLAQLGFQLVTSPATTYRMTYSHTDDFPQFHGFGRPIDSVGLDVRFRLAPNIGIDVGRAYSFDWGGQRWAPQWSFAILP